MTTPLVCPECSIGSLDVTAAIELPPDGSSDEITLSALVCSGCGFQAVAVYEESRHGALGDDLWRHQGYPTARDRRPALAALVARCPDPSNKRCHCPVHRRLDDAFGSGSWPQVLGIVEGGRFPIRYAP